MNRYPFLCHPARPGLPWEQPTYLWQVKDGMNAGSSEFEWVGLSEQLPITLCRKKPKGAPGLAFETWDPPGRG
jgi:hypothetical protein